MKMVFNCRIRNKIANEIKTLNVLFSYVGESFIPVLLKIVIQNLTCLLRQTGKPLLNCTTV